MAEWARGDFDKIHPNLPLQKEGKNTLPFNKPTKEAKGSKAELVRHRFPDSTTGVRGDFKGDF